MAPQGLKCIQLVIAMATLTIHGILIHASRENGK
jgi:hypothetical protein